MKLSLNNRGFTLVELLAVLVILIAIMAIAIPSISSSLERSKSSQNEQKYKVLEVAAKVYITDYKNKLNDDNVKCYITIDELVSNGYLSSDDVKDSYGNILVGIIEYTFADDSFEFTDSSSFNKCIS